MIEIIDVDQGSGDWFAVRAGIPTASMFATVMAEGDGKTRTKYLRTLAGEIITGEPAQAFSNFHMDRGKAMEDEARETYALVYDAEPIRVGFVRNGQKGASPDSLIGTNGGLEIKTAQPDIQIDRLERDRLPPEHVAQVQGNLLVTEREYWDFVSFWPKLPMLRVRVYRDEPYIKRLSAGIDAFNEELALLVDRIRSYGNPREHLKNSLVQSLMAG